MVLARFFRSLVGKAGAARHGLTHTLTRLIVVVSFPASFATLIVGTATGDPLFIAGGACGLAAPILGIIQIRLRRAHPSLLMVLWTAPVLLLAWSPVPVVAEASGLGLSALGTAVILVHAPRHAGLYLGALGGTAGGLLMVTHGVGPATALAAAILATTIWGSTVLHAQVARRLRQSEARFRGAFEDAPIAMVLADDSGIRRVNPAFEAMLGYREDEVRGYSLESIAPPADRPAPGQSPLAPAASDHSATPFEQRYLRRDGTVMWGHTALTTLRDPFTDEAHHVVQILDVTRSRASLDAIVQAEERHRSLLSYMPVALWEEDFSAVADWLEELRRNGVRNLTEYFRLHPDEVARGARLIRVIDVNDAAVSLVQADRKEDLLGSLLEATVTEETRDSLIAQFLAVWDGEASTSVEVLGSTVGGQRIECELQWVAPMVAGKRDLRRVVVAITDLTERNRTRTELRQRVALEALIARLSTDFINLRPEQTDDGIERALRAIGRHVGADRAYLFCFSSEGSRFSITHEWGAPGVRSMKQRVQNVPTAAFPWLAERLRLGRTVLVPRVADLPAEAAIERAGWEEERISSLILVPLLRAGSAVGFVGLDSVAGSQEWSEADARLVGLVGEMFLNTLERKAADERLAALMRSKDDLIASVSHELRTPLTTVLGLAEELRTERDLSLDERRQLLGYIVEQSRDLSHLVEDLLVASRVDTGQLKVAVEQISLREQVDQTLRGLRTPDDRSIEPPATDAAAWADALRVRQIVRNLLTNALRYGGPHIRLALEARGHSAALLVHDDGPGIPESEQGSMFDPAGARATKGQPGSLGLGLSLSRRLARLMGGDLTYQGQKGSVFELVLPARDPLAVLPLAEPVDSTDSSADHLPRERAAAGRRLGDGT